MSTSTRTLQATRAARRRAQAAQAAQEADRPVSQLPLFRYWQGVAAAAGLTPCPMPQPGADEAQPGDDGQAMAPDSAPDDVPYQPQSRTSQSAARALRQSGRAASLEAQVLDFFTELAPAGCTDIELEAAMRDRGASFVTLRPRRIALCRRGEVRDSGERRLTPSGRQAVVWCLAPGARA